MATVTFANDSPHANDVVCDYCHNASGTGGPAPSPFWGGTYVPANLEDTSMNLLCTGCHDSASNAPPAPTTAMSVRTHTSRATRGNNDYGWGSGQFTVECVACHNPHYQRQYVYFRNLAPIKLAQGTVNTIAYDAGESATYGIPVSRITFTLNVPGSKAAWTDPATWVSKSADNRGAIIYPNSANVNYSFSVLEKVDATTILIRGNVTTGLGTTALGAGKTFMITYGQAVKEKIFTPGQTDPVTYRWASTGTSAAVKFLDATGTNSFADAVAPADGICQVCHTKTAYWKADGTGTSHNSGAKCTTCHPHSEGFKASGCDQCHGYPPINTATLVFKDKDSNWVTSDSTSAGAHAVHVAKYSQCQTCHTGGMTSAATGDNKINIGFNLGGDLGGRYDGNTARPVYPTAVGAGSFTTITGGNTLACSSLYCHSSGQGNTANNATPSYATPTWTNPASGDCGTCHLTTTIASGSHSQHIGSGLSMGCNDCHSNVASNGSWISSAVHVNKLIEVTNSYTAGGTPGNGYGQCNARACHGGDGVTAQSPTWGTTHGETGCTRCHGAAANGNAAPGPDNAGNTWTSGAQVGAHQTHLKAWSSFSAPIACTECHAVPATVQAAEHIKDATPGVAELTWGTLARTNGSGAVGTPAYASNQCSNVYCHDSARFKNAYGGGTGLIPTWANNAYLGNGKALDCGTCHGNPPGGAHPGAPANACSGCHANVNAAGDGFVNLSLHVNGIVEGTSGCTGCHNMGKTLAGKHAIHYDWNTDATGRLTTNTSTAANYVYQCGVCHNAADGHPRGAVGVNLAWVSFAGGGAYTAGGAWSTDSRGMKISTNGTCNSVYCHSNASPSGGTNSYTNVMWNTTVGCGSCHKTTDTYANMTTAGTPQPMSGPHAQHMASDRYGANAIFSCNTCHSSTASNNTTISDKSKHADSQKTVTFNATSGGSWSTSLQCSNTYCHSAGTASSGTHTGRSWTSSVTCASCHGDAATLATGAHTAHVNNTAGVGRTVGCTECHNATASNNTTISSYANHVDKNVNIRFDGSNLNRNADGPTFNGSPAWSTVSAGATKAAGATPAGTCATVYCHSTGNLDATGTVIAAGGVSFKSTAWNTAVGCDGCHGGNGKAYPWYTSGAAAGTTANSHVKHVEGSSYGCDYCHNTTTLDAAIPPTTVTNGGAHLNRVENVSFKLNNGSTGLWNSVGKTCSATYCHGSGASTAWGGTVACDSCHTASNTGLSTRHAQHYNTATVATQLAGGTDSHTATTYVYACLKCHPTNSHATGPYSAAQAAWVTGTKMSSYTPSAAWTTDSRGYNYTVYGTCATVCHTKDGATAGTAIVPNPSWGTLNALGCGYCHSAQGVASPTWTTPHSKHVNTYTQFTCNYCHNSTATNNTTIAGAAGRNQHPDSTKQVSFNAWTSGAGAGWSGTQCSNTYCHSTGTAAVGTHAAINWNVNTAVACASCHGNNGAGWSSILTGSHGQHISQGYTCNSCHNATASNNSTISNIANHVDKNVQINFWGSVAPAGATYNGAAAGGASVSTKAVGSAYSSCSTTYCHGANSAQWGSNTNTAQCTKCHGVAGTTPAQYTAQPNTAAPGWATIGVNTSGLTGALTNNVSNDSKVGAHYGHLANKNGYSTFGQVVCNDCHTVPATVNDPTHSNGVTNMNFSTIARNIGTSYWNSVGNTLNSSYAAGSCSNVYCHGAAFWTSVKGTGIQPGWTSSAYLTPYAKNDANCDKCHYTPPVASTRYNHSSMTIASACAGCHNHEGSGATHIDGNLYGAGDCNICHDYDTRANVAWGTGYTAGSGLVANSTAWGAHKKHVDHVKTLWGSVLDAANDTFGSANYNAVCGVCHTRNTNNHMDTNRQVNFGDNVWGSMNQFGTSLPFWNTTAGSRSCSNLDCHYKATPQW